MILRAFFLLIATALTGFAQQSFIVTGHIVKLNTLLPPPSFCADCRIGAQVVATVQHAGRKIWDTPDTKVWTLGENGNSLTIRIGGTVWHDRAKFSIQPPNLAQAAITIQGDVYDAQGKDIRSILFEALEKTNVATARFRIAGGLPGEPPPARYWLQIQVDSMTEGEQEEPGSCEYSTAGPWTWADSKGVCKAGNTYRGRIQAQGGGLEASVQWNLNRPPTVAEGLVGLETLKAKLTPRQVREREKAFVQAAIWITRVGVAGGVGPEATPRSFPQPPIGNIRVDIEIKAGRAFVPVPTQ